MEQKIQLRIFNYLSGSDEMMKCCWVNSCYLGNRQLAYLGEIEALT